MSFCLRLCLMGLLLCTCASAQADSTPNFYGALGLNMVPNARMEKAGTVRFNLAHLDPYVQTSLGLQLHDRAYIALRQTSEMSSLMDDPKHVYPGLDFKYKLFTEKKFRPEIAIGMQSAFGHRRMAGEYLALSKRYENWDVTAGFGWGRFGTRHSTPNPLDWTGHYFDKNRKLDGEEPNGPEDWFTGDTGFFAGVEYKTPIEGLSIKADLSSDAYKAEKDAAIDAPWAYSFGLNYQPRPYLDMGVALLDKDTVMARLSIKSFMKDWPFAQSDHETLFPVPAYPKADVQKQSETYRLNLSGLKTDTRLSSAQLHLMPYRSSAHQMSQSWRILANDKDTDPSILRVEPIYFGLKAPALSVSRADLENASRHHGSAEEMWHHLSHDNALSSAGYTIKSFIPYLTLRDHFTLGEDDAPFLHRLDVLATLTRQMNTYFLTETSLRYNAHSNFKRLDEFRLPNDKPVRSDAPRYVDDHLSVERMFIQGFKSFNTDLHATASAGYLEEMFSGYHGEILYRPWGRNWALGAEAGFVIKRDPSSSFHLDLTDESFTTAHLNFFYEVPNTDMTIGAKLGQYLGGDHGASLSLKSRFTNGSHIEAFFTATGKQDVDVYGSDSNFMTGIKLAFPLGSMRYLPDGSRIELNAMPVGRDAGQTLDIAHPLYEMTEPLSYRHLSQTWADVVN